MDKRKDARFSAQFRSSFSSANTVSGSGLLGELSIRGCRISSSAPVKPGTEIELRFEISPDMPPLQVRQAVVRWCRDGNFGVEFINFTGDEWNRLRELVKELEKEPFERDKRGDPAA